MIGLIFGETNLPKLILKRVKSKKIKYVIIDLSSKNIFKKENNSYNPSIGQFGKVIKILKDNKCSKVLFAGKIKKPNLSKINLDFKGIYYFPKILKSSKIGDAALLKEIIKILKKEKINTISSTFFNPELVLSKGIYTKIKPTVTDYMDIKKGINTLNRLNSYSFSQGVVVRNNKIISVEGKNGTDSMLIQCKSKNVEKNGVLIKFPKKKQDLRIDLPTIGIKSLILCKSANLKGIILKSRKNIFLDKKRCIEFANKNKMFILIK